MAVGSHAGCRGHVVSRVDPVARIAKPGVSQPGRAPNRNGTSRQADWFFETLGDRADAASGKEELHSHRGRERRGEMDLAAASRGPPPRWAISPRAHQESRAAPGESES